MRQGLRIGIGPAMALAAVACASPTTDSREYRGMAVHFADATTLEDCGSGARWPVPMEADHLALERALLAAGAEPASPVWVRVDGRLEPREPEPGLPPRTHLVVEQFIEARPGWTCDGPRSEPFALFETRWVLLAFDGLVRDADDTPPHLELSRDERKAFGYSGCNRFFASYEHAGDADLSFGPIAVTMMACRAPRSELEVAFLSAMKAVRAYRIEGRSLQLLDDAGGLLLEFEPDEPVPAASPD